MVSQKYLGFEWLGIFYHYLSLPQGITSGSAPFIFTEVAKPMVQSWRAEGIRILPYLDDFTSGALPPYSNASIAITWWSTCAALVSTSKMPNSWAIPFHPSKILLLVAQLLSQLKLSVLNRSTSGDSRLGQQSASRTCLPCQNPCPSCWPSGVPLPLPWSRCTYAYSLNVSQY